MVWCISCLGVIIALGMWDIHSDLKAIRKELARMNGNDGDGNA
jgi:hypothetical protein